ncbi:MAG: class II aldolase/adducin family protein [Campylobacterota bacterium]|nr:class II aldolase/adducin family protein [Campylobacterota bacterium]
MKNLWDEKEAKNYESDLALRVYSSNLLGRSDELVLHGGGNTSVKKVAWDQDVLFVKGSGWDLVSIEEEGFAPVELTFLQDMAKVEALSDTQMVQGQKKAMLNKEAPNPSVEAILHAIIPFKYVDHTHADAVVTISNCSSGIENIKKIYPNFLIVPYVMPGFILARTIYEMTKKLDWSKCEGIILHNHGIFTFDDDAKRSYDKMIDAVTIAENFLEENAKLQIDETLTPIEFDTEKLKDIISEEKNSEIFININQSPLALHYSSQDNLDSFATRGVLTPEHIIRTKRAPLILEANDNIQTKIEQYKKEYITYFERFKKGETMLNPAPNYAVIKNFGIVSFGKSQKEANIINDIITHTMTAVLKADMLGGYESISYQDSFDMEYWELEQAKLKKQ